MRLGKASHIAAGLEMKLILHHSTLATNCVILTLTGNFTSTSLSADFTR